MKTKTEVYTDLLEKAFGEKDIQLKAFPEGGEPSR